MPYCICCFEEYGDNVELCPECGAPLSEEKGGVATDIGVRKPDTLPWPTDDSGDQLTPAFLMTAQNPMEFELVCSMLRAYDIPVVGQDTVRDTFSQVLFGGPLLGSDLFVPENMLERARDILAARPEQPEEDF